MAKCRSCTAEVVWARHDSGKWSCFVRADAGNWMIDNGTAIRMRPGCGQYVSHFADCPQAAGWRGRGKQGRLFGDG